MNTDPRAAVAIDAENRLPGAHKSKTLKRHVSIDAENPWPGLSAFDEASEAFFTGRDAEAAELLRLVGQAPLTVLFGKSGLGKTSLLQAGLFPRLRLQNFLPIHVRLEVRSQAGPLIEQLGAALQEEVAGHGVDAVAPHPHEHLWEYLHRDVRWWSPRNQPLTPLFVLDQFEEVFTLGTENAAAVERLRLDLSDLVENRIPRELAARIEAGAMAEELELRGQRYKVLVSFREDFLPDVEGWKNELPSLMRNRLRLLPMNGRRALQVVSGRTATGRTHELVSDEAARAIVGFVAAIQKPGDTTGDRGSARSGGPSGASNRRGGPSGPPVDGRQDADENLDALEIEPALLSLVCAGLNEKRKNRGQAAVDAALLAETGHAIITDFYQSCVADVPENTRRFIEDALITEGGFRNSYPLQDALDQGQLSEAVLARLVDRRLLRVDHQLGITRVELIHDRLTDAVREHRNLQRVQRERRQQRRRMLAASVIAAIGLGVAAAMVYLWTNAEAQRSRAEGESEKAVTLRSLAEKESANALVQAEIARRREGEASVASQLARSRELMAFASEQLTQDPELSVLLGREAVNATTNTDSLAMLQRALSESLVRKRFQASSAALRGAVFIDAGRRVVTAGADGAVRVWDASSGKMIRALAAERPAILGLKVSGDGRLIVAWSANMVRAWDASTLTPAWQLPVSPIGGVELSPCCRRLLIRSGNNVILVETDKGREVARQQIDDVEGAGFTERGETFVTVGDSPVPAESLTLCGRWRIQRWRADTGAQVGMPWDLRTRYGSVLINEHGTNIISGSTGRAEVGESCSYLDTPVWLFVPEQAATTLIGSVLGGVSAVSFSAEDPDIAAVAAGPVVNVWRAQPDSKAPSVSQRLQLTYTARVNALAFSANGMTLLAADDDDTVHVSEVTYNTAVMRATLRANGHKLVSSVFGPDARYVLTAGEDGSARLWDIPPARDPHDKPPLVCARCRSADDWLAFAATRLTRTFTEEEKKRFGIE